MSTYDYEEEPKPCHFCGTYGKNGYEYNPETKHFDIRHWLSDCRPDLVLHEIGETCTWYGDLKPCQDCQRTGVVHINSEFPVPCKKCAGEGFISRLRHDGNPDCYAYQDFWSQEWTDEHTHFHKDGPMI